MPEKSVNKFNRRLFVFLTVLFACFLLSSSLHAQSFPKAAPIDFEKLFSEKLKKGGRFLDLNGSKIGDEGIALLVKSPVIKRLVKLDLRYNGISAEGARMLAKAEFPKLKNLILRHNILGDDGAEAIAQSKGFPSLEALQLGWAEVRDRGALAYINASLPKLKKLDLRGNFLAGSTKSSLKQNLSHFKSLKLY